MSLPPRERQYEADSTPMIRISSPICSAAWKGSSSRNGAVGAMLKRWNAEIRGGVVRHSSFWYNLRIEKRRKEMKLNLDSVLNEKDAWAAAASEVRHRRHARGDGEKPRVGPLRRRQHLPRFHRLSFAAPLERGARQDRHHRVRHFRLRGDRQDLRRARQPDIERPPQSRRDYDARSARRRRRGCQGEFRGQEVDGAPQGGLPLPVAQDAILHDYREGLSASPHRRFAHACRRGRHEGGPRKGAPRDVDRRRASP